MVRYMADAIDPGIFPASIAVPGSGVQPVALRAGYVNGKWPTAIQAGTEVTIDVNGGAPGADVLDIETGDATPDAAPGWVRAHHRQTSERAVLYCNRSTRPAVASYCAGAGLVPGRDFWWWISTLDGTRTVADMTGVVAVQAWSADFFDRDIDLSIVYDDSWKGTGDMPLNNDDKAFITGVVRDSLRSEGISGAGDANVMLDRGYRAQFDGVKAAIPAAQQVAVDPVALAAALLANPDAIGKLGDAIAAGLATRVHNG